MDTETAQKEKPPKKKSIARRIVKGVLWLLGGLLAFVILAVLTLPTPLSHLSRKPSATP